MPPILNETIANHNVNILSNQLNSNDINDYVYNMIFIKTKKAININVQQNKKFIKKYVDKYDSNKQIPNPNLKNVNNILKNDL
jgi:hypothetical protein